MTHIRLRMRIALRRWVDCGCYQQRHGYTLNIPCHQLLLLLLPELAQSLCHHHSFARRATMTAGAAAVTNAAAHTRCTNPVTKGVDNLLTPRC